MVHRAGAGDPWPGGGRRVVRVEAAADRAARLPGGVADGREPERSLEQRPARVRLGRECAHAVEALQRDLGGDLRVAATSGASDVWTTASSSPSPSGSSKPEPVVLAPRRDPLVRRGATSQKSSASSEATRKVIVCTMPAPARPRRAPGYSKNVMSAPGLPSSSA